MPMKNFGRYVGIDWTGAKSPIHSKNIAVAHCARGQSSPELIRQNWSRQSVCDYIENCLKSNERILIGIDCNFGYAAEIIRKQLGVEATALDLWRIVDSLNETETNFFAGHFWTHETYQHDFWTDGKKPEGMTLPRRITETRCGESGYGWPESPFKMIGTKQVGKGGLAGMRMAHYLKSKHGGAIAIWPFDEPDIWNSAQIVMTEIYPRQFIMRAGYGLKKLRHIHDLNSALKALDSEPVKNDDVTDHETDALIAAAGMRYLCGASMLVPDDLAQPINDRDVLKREGWIFGVGCTA